MGATKDIDKKYILDELVSHGFDLENTRDYKVETHKEQQVCYGKDVDSFVRSILDEGAVVKKNKTVYHIFEPSDDDSEISDISFYLKNMGQTSVNSRSDWDYATRKFVTFRDHLIKSAFRQYYLIDYVCSDEFFKILSVYFSGYEEKIDDIKSKRKDLEEFVSHNVKKWKKSNKVRRKHRSMSRWYDDANKMILDMISDVYPHNQVEFIQKALTYSKSKSESDNLYMNKDVSDNRLSNIIKRLSKYNTAREELIEKNLPLVVSLAKKYKINFNIDFMDMIAEGNLGLITASERYEKDTGARFSTYASFWIKQKLGRILDMHTRCVRIPVHVLSKKRKFNSFRKKFIQKNEREPSKEEFIEALNLSEYQYFSLIESFKSSISLDLGLNDSGDDDLYRLIENEEASSPHEDAIESDLKERVNKVVDRYLGVREAMVLSMRYGLRGYEVHTLDDTGKRFGLTRERIRQIESKAIDRLRRLARRDLEDFIEFVEL